MLPRLRPSAEQSQRFRAAQAKLPFSYRAVGATGHTPPAGYAVDHARVQIGTGEAAFRSACCNLRQWRHLRTGRVEVVFSGTPIRPGEVVVVLGRALGLSWLNACRIVYVVDDHGPVTRFGFAYGTLQGHLVSGEERFLIEWDRSEGSVWYDILSFSRPNHLVTRIGHALLRRTQQQFRRDSAAAMIRAGQ